MTSRRRGGGVRRGALVLAGLLVGCVSGVVCGAPPVRPNVLVLLADDLGARDLGCDGSTFHVTPSLDRLASEGVRFTQAYAAGSVCSPTRASLMTGQVPARVGITDWIPGRGEGAGAVLRTPEDLHALPGEQVTLAEAFGEAGYSTWYGGKWHLGGAGSMPTDHGFELYFNELGGEGEWGVRAGVTRRRALLDSSRRLAEGVVSFMEGRDASRPFLAMVSYRDVHTPIQRIPGFVAASEARRRGIEGETPVESERDGRTRLRQDSVGYASMVAALDHSVGTILDHLDRLGLAGSTVVVFLSDNGGLSTIRSKGPTSNAPLRAGKGWLYEGGIRIPMLVRGPGVRTGTSDVPVLTTDVYPTLLTMAGLGARASQHVDGVSFVGSLRARISRVGPARDRVLGWHYPHYHGSMWRPGSAVRVGDWKLIRFDEAGEVELYDLARDPGERADLAGEAVAKRRELEGVLERWLDDVGAARVVRRGEDGG